MPASGFKMTRVPIRALGYRTQPGRSETIGQRMERDLEVLLPLPPVAYDACEKQAGRVSSLSLVRYRRRRGPRGVSLGGGRA